MNIGKKIIVIIIALIYGLIIFKNQDNKALLAFIPLITTIITVIICEKTDKFTYNISLEGEKGSKIKILLDIYNLTTDIYQIQKIKIGKLPEEIVDYTIKRMIEKPEKIIKIIDGPLSTKSKYVNAVLYVKRNANKRQIKYPKIRILNPNFEITATSYYKIKNKRGI
jgi:hypothetical protein